jgi:ubiquitin-like domain-containing CTD phosphatase 1
MADPTSTSSPSSSITFALKWRADAFDVTLPLASTVLDLKRAVEEKTNVPAASVKVLGLKLSSGLSRPPADSDPLSALAAPKRGGPRLMVMGTPAAAAAAVVAAAAEAAAAAAAAGAGAGGLLDEDAAAAAAAAAAQQLDGEDDPAAIASDPDNQAKLSRRISAFELKLREQPRPGARALVLDIDYTIFDLGSAAERPELLARPHLHEFMTAAYSANFDIFIWSANSMKWIEVKMRELG